MNQKKLLFIFNPHAGRGLIRVRLADILDIFVKAGYEVTTYPTQAKDDILNKIPEWAGHFDRIVCCGGDGTLDETVAGMIKSEARTPIGYIPAGTTNDFAKSLGISTDMVEAAHIAAGGRLFNCDVGRFNNSSFIYIAAFGVFTAVSYQTDQRLKGVLGHAAYLVEGTRSLTNIPSYGMELEMNGKTISGKFSYGMITNAVSVGGMKNLTGSTVSLDDGMFEVTFVKTPQNPRMLGDILTNLFSSGDNNSPYIYTEKADYIRIRSNENIPWTLDGEFGGDHSDVEIRNLKHKVTFIIPEGDVAEGTTDA